MSVEKKKKTSTVGSRLVFVQVSSSCKLHTELRTDFPEGYTKYLGTDAKIFAYIRKVVIPVLRKPDARFRNNSYIKKNSL